MADAGEPIVILNAPVERAVLERLLSAYFGDMVKFVADLERGWLAVGGELHADAEELLLERGSRLVDLWGGNYYPGRAPEHCLEYTSFINIRPAYGNRSMEVTDPGLRARMRSLVARLLGEGREEGLACSTPT